MPYSDSCREKILSEDYRDFIVSDIRMPFLQDLLEKDYCLQNPGFFYQCAYLPKSVINPVSLERYSYFSIPKCYSLLSMQALNQAGILPIQNHSTHPIKRKTGNDRISGYRNRLSKIRYFNIWIKPPGSQASGIRRSKAAPLRNPLTMALIIHAI